MLSDSVTSSPFVMLSESVTSLLFASVDVSPTGEHDILHLVMYCLFLVMLSDSVTSSPFVMLSESVTSLLFASVDVSPTGEHDREGQYDKGKTQLNIKIFYTIKPAV